MLPTLWLIKDTYPKPLDHPDLDVIPRVCGIQYQNSLDDSYETWKLIANSLPSNAKRVLDIEACFGFFTQKLEELGFEGCVVETNEENLTILKQYRQMKGKNFTVWENPLLELDDYNFDIILILNGLPQYVMEDQEQLIAFFKKMACQALYFQYGSGKMFTLCHF